VGIALLCIASAGCTETSPASSETQRRIGEARLQEDLFVSLTYGAVRGFTSDELVVRSASPLVSLEFEAGPEAEGPIDVELRNVHLDAQLRVATAAILDADDLDGCPVISASELDCVAATEAIGDSCETSGQCPEGLRCAMGECTPTDVFDACTAPDFRRLEGQETSLQFDFPATPCRRIQLETVLPDDAPQDLRFGVIGPSRDVELVANLADTFRDESLDFVVLLGDNLATSSLDGLAELERTLILLGTPVVVVAGPREIAPNNGEAFLRRFGPHDHVWSLKGNRFFAFYSAESSLGPRGLSRLETFLAQLDDSSEQDSPLFGVTHVPPFDPNDLRDAGFRNDIEASQVVSTFESFGVDQLFAGSLSTGFERFHDLEVVTTTARGTLVNPRSEWVLVESRVDSGDGEGRVIGDRVVSFERRLLR
jgi:hypothetical protein